MNFRKLLFVILVLISMFTVNSIQDTGNDDGIVTGTIENGEVIITEQNQESTSTGGLESGAENSDNEGTNEINTNQNRVPISQPQGNQNGRDDDITQTDNQNSDTQSSENSNNENSQTLNSCGLGAGTFYPSEVYVANQLNYYEVARTLDRNDLPYEADYIMFRGGFAHNVPVDRLETTPLGDSSHIKYPISQEEIWISKSRGDLKNWAPLEFSFGITPQTPVAFKDNRPYSEVYPNSFVTKCEALGNNGQCNVQINDPSVVIIKDDFGEHYYMYFSILENYRWYSGEYGELSSYGPGNPSEMNRHSIGLATSNDGLNWAFVDKIITEYPPDADLSNGEKEEVLGAWAPSAVKISDSVVDIYFHDAYGTKQYVARLEDGVSIRYIKRLNPNDSFYRVNFDVERYNDGYYYALYNDPNFNIVRTKFSSVDDFSKMCEPEIIIPSDGEKKPAPAQFLEENGDVNVFFWEMDSGETIHHWVLEAEEEPKEDFVICPNLDENRCNQADTCQWERQPREGFIGRFIDRVWFDVFLCVPR